MEGQIVDLVGGLAEVDVAVVGKALVILEAVVTKLFGVVEV